MSSENTQRTALEAVALGALVLSRDGGRIAAVGVCADSNIADAAEQAWAQSADRKTGRRLFPVETGQHRYIGLCQEDDQHRLILLHRADASTALFDFLGSVPFAGAILDHFLTSPYEAIVVADHAGQVRYVSPVHEKFLGLNTGEGIGRPAANVIPNSRLPQVAASGKAEIGQLQQMNGVTRVVNRIPIREAGEVVGAIGQVMFKGPEAITRMHEELSELRSQVVRYRRELDGLRESPSPYGLIGESAPMQRLRREIETVARLDVPVLILGESGTGKELVARAIHAAGSEPARERPLVSLNLAALPATLIESELFGHVPGAFTGSQRKGQAGKLAIAAGGTVFLDEVADVPMEVQVKLLRVLEDRQVQRLGAHSGRQVNFRIVAATHRDLRGLIDSGRFRLDLFYRLSGVVLHVPALRQRLEDIPALVQRFAQSFCERNGIALPRIAPGVMPYLARQAWPGNVRQLRQRVEEALVFCDGHLLGVDNFARHEDPLAGARPLPVAEAGMPSTGAVAPLKDQERNAILDAIARCGGNKKLAAQELGISRSYLYKVLGAASQG